jgi:hypothetical protein
LTAAGGRLFKVDSGWSRLLVDDKKVKNGLLILESRLMNVQSKRLQVGGRIQKQRKSC